MSIGDPARILQKWDSFLQVYRNYEPNLAYALELRKVQRESQDNWYNLRTKEEWRNFTTIEASLRMFPKNSFAHGRSLEVYNLFLSLLQQYEMPPAIRKKVEKAVQFWSKARQKRTNTLEESIEVFTKVMSTYEGQIQTAKAALAQGKLRSTEEEGAKVLNAGPFKVVNTGDFSQESMSIAASIVKEAAERLQRKGLSEVCYGEMHLSNRLKGARNLAFYHIASDEMFIRGDLNRNDNEALKTVLHELGHRYYYKFVKGEAAVHNIYSRLKGVASALKSQLIDEVMGDPQKRPNPGDLYTGNKITWVVDRVSYKGRKSGYQIHLHNQADPTKTGMLSLESWIRAKKYKLDNAPSDFVTTYAGTSPEENFAEMFAYYCLDKLPADQVEMIKATLV